MSGAFVEPIGHIKRTVRSGSQIAGSEPGIVGDEQLAAVGSFESRTPGFEVVPLDAVAEQIVGDVFAAELFGQSIGLINNSAVSDVAAGEVCVRDMLEVTISVRVVESAMLAEAFPIVTALHAMGHAVG